MAYLSRNDAFLRVQYGAQFVRLTLSSKCATFPKPFFYMNLKLDSNEEKAVSSATSGLFPSCTLPPSFLVNRPLVKELYLLRLT